MPKMTIAGVEVDLPDAAHAHLTAQAAAQQELAAKVATADAEKAARLRETADAAARAEQQKLIDKGQYQEALAAKDKEVKQVADRFLTSELRSQIASHPQLRKAGLDDAARAALIDDVLVQMRTVSSYDLTAGRVQVTVDGKAVDPRAHLDAYLAARPHLREPSGQSGSGAASGVPGTGTPNNNGKRGSMTLEQKVDFIKANGQAAYLALPD